MIAHFGPRTTVPGPVFTQVQVLVDKSGAAELIERIHERRRLPGGRTPSGITYAVRAVLVAIGCLIMQGRTPSLAATFAMLIEEFTDEQRTQVGMVASADQLQAVTLSRKAHSDEYKRFGQWLTRRLAGLDSHRDIPARKLRNVEMRALMTARDARARAASRTASHLAHVVCNQIVAASVADPTPVGYDGDLVADESIYDVAQIQRGDGMKPDARRSAVSFASFYRREKGTVRGAGAAGRADKMGFGFGLTAITRVGSPGNVRAVVPLTTAIAFGPPTPGSVEAVRRALWHHRQGGFDPRTGAASAKNSRLPMLLTHMGYSVRDGWAELLHEQAYAVVARYPTGWGLVSEALPTAGSGEDQTPGPIHAHGAWYCPAAASLVGAPLVKRGRDIIDQGIEAHDQRLAKLLPLLMGVNGRVRMAPAGPGRPKKGAGLVPKLPLICPAVQGRVRCPLKPESLRTPASDAPTIYPEWSASEKACCERSHLTVTFSPRQFKLHQGGPPPGSWEHTAQFEAYRALTERVFSVLKSPYLSDIQAMNWGPRREPMIMIIIAMAVAFANIQMQLNGTVAEVDSITDRLRGIERHLGRPLTKAPPRT